MPQTGALGLLATLAAVKIAVLKRKELRRTQFQISLSMLANGRACYKESRLRIAWKPADESEEILLS